MARAVRAAATLLDADPMHLLPLPNATAGLNAVVPRTPKDASSLALDTHGDGLLLRSRT